MVEHAQEQPIRIGTRKSELALWQARHVASALETLGYPSTLIKMSTRGDEILDRSLSKVGGKGLFVRELQDALLGDAVDLIVHSAKDMPTELPLGTAIIAFMKRGDPRDLLVGVQSINDLANKARVGTSSLRRAACLKALRPDLEIVPIRGNVQTRLSKIESEGLDAIVLAKVGLERLGLLPENSCVLDPEIMIPAVAQGVLALECRVNDSRLHDFERLADPYATLTSVAERAFLKEVQGSCQVPVGAYGSITDDELSCRAFVGHPSDGRIVMSTASCELSRSSAGYQVESQDVRSAEILGAALATKLLNQGARDILCDLGLWNVPKELSSRPQA